MKCFVTGGSGFFGCHLLETLLREGAEVVVYDRDPLDPAYTARGVRFIQGDVCDKEHMTETMRGCDVVHHNAAVLPISRSGKKFLAVNVGGTRNVLEAALQNGVRKVIMVSTSAVYGIPATVPITEETPLTPLGEYGWSKFHAEEVCRAFRAAHGLDVSIARPRTLVGTGRLGIFGILFDWIRRGKRVYVIGNGKNLFQLLSPRDLAEGCHLIATQPCKNEDFNFGAETFSTVADDMNALIAHAKTAARVVPVNAFLVRTVLSTLDLLRLSPLVDWHYKTPHKPFYFDITKAKTMLGWTPKDTNVSMLTDTYDWFLEHKDVESHYGTTHRKNVKQRFLKLLRALS